MSVITSISTALPTYKHKQSDLGEFMSELYQYSEHKKKKLQIMYSKSGIRHRYSVIPDYSSNKEDSVFFPKTHNLEPFPNIEYRMQYFNKTALPLCINAIENCIKGKIQNNQITHLITVSCTGLSAPGLDIDIVQFLKLNSTINRTSINFMGCYAAIHALKQADYICKSEPNAIVLVVCVELCTIHFQKIDDLDNTIANLLFADGCAAALVVSDGIALKNKFEGFKIKKFHSQIELSGKQDMTWQLSSTGFLMSLSSYIPQLIEKGFKNLFEDSINGLEIKKKDITHWAIHPGGRKILEVIQKELELQNTDLESSYKVLKNYGNMSSPTILFVLKDIWDNKASPNKKELTYGVAFGPGLTMESVILENV
ncbi:MAG: putative naringenin-chalcone synthase [Mucilaginibacter sp.]|nr:putative naringenin-chalcone synthase [Mucilaginibacter sp.]